MKIKKDDMVAVLAGKEKGKKGKVLRVFKETNKVIVEGVAIVKKSMKATGNRKKGQIIEKALPIHVSNVALIDPKTDKPTRTGSKVIGGKKVRVSKRTGVEI